MMGCSKLAGSIYILEYVTGGFLSVLESVCTLFFPVVRCAVLVRSDVHISRRLYGIYSPELYIYPKSGCVAYILPHVYSPQLIPNKAPTPGQ
jgi:hypothetical protein